MFTGQLQRRTHNNPANDDHPATSYNNDNHPATNHDDHYPHRNGADRR